LAQGELNLNLGEPSGNHGFASELHSSLARGSPAFDLVALDTSRNNVGPIFSTALNGRNHVIQSQLFRVKFFVAVLAAEFVSNVNILS
jgi:hypothetical protein